MDPLHADGRRRDVELDNTEDSSHSQRSWTRPMHTSRTARPKIYSHDLVELIFTQPYCRIGNLVERGIAERHSGSTYLKELVTLGVSWKRRRSGATRSSCTASISMCCSATSTPSSRIRGPSVADRAEAPREGKSMTDRPHPPRRRPARASPPPPRPPSATRPPCISSPSPRPSAPTTSCPCSRPAIAGSARTACRRPRASGRRCAQRFPDIELHLIGPLQSNKASEAVELFDAIHTVDRPKIARGHRRRDGQAGQAAQAVHRGQHRRGAAEGRRDAEGGGRPCCACAARS